MKLELYEVSDEERARDEFWRVLHDVDRAWHALAVHLCDKGQGGHLWELVIDPDEGFWLTCRRCRADVDDLCPDGHELMTGEFEVFPGYVLSLNFGSVHVNGTDYDGFAYGWRGPVTAVVDVTRYPGGPWGSEEWDVWVVVEAEHDAV
jgi:hypothetical protein